MRFCEECGARMVATKEGLECTKCGKAVSAKDEVQFRRKKQSDGLGGIYVPENSITVHATVIRRCPECGSNEAVHWFSGISGEHAGIRRERTIEHFRCKKCFFTWTEES